MKKLLAMYKGLPAEVRMMLAMAGLGTPLGAIYILKRYLFPGMSHFMVILLVGGVVAAICLIGLLIAKLAGRGAHKRTQRMATELAADSAAGPVAMDVRAAVKANNDKFFTAIRDMRRNVGLSVYDLPWYIVIGDSGCGKTKLVNEGGLTFSTGKPEGYQLGTLNYNWWFTEDAVFIDMAGRLCNPRDDHDRREWEAFLSTVGKGRKGFPINGALVCVSADHLMQDSPEKIEQYANTTLERLRDLQTRLGVTFATYLIVTKCDKIIGFIQCFDRAERDITFKNQIFGWSKPGSFHELYDPEQFAQDFDQLYARLHELRLRRLHDDADETDLGLAYSFPEEFRELLPPLQTYVRTLFPMIKNPRAIKNLIFRGVYFTSATQEGALILKHLTERLGVEAAGQFAPLDLYPNKRPHFIKDLLFQKVVPEHGLVFRHAEQVLRNRRMAQALKWGSAVLFVLTVLMLAVSSHKFGKVIGTPRSHAAEARPEQDRTATDAMKASGVLGTDVGTLQANLGWAKVLSLGFGARQPIQDLNTIRAGLFERVLLRQSLLEAGQALRTTELRDPRDGAEAQRAALTYLAALEQYVMWFGCAGAKTPPESLTFESFQKLFAVVTDKESALVAQKEQLLSHAAAYFTGLRGGGEWRNPAACLTDSSMDATGTVAAALKGAHKYLAGYATLNDTHPDPLIREWMRIRTQCAAIQTGYAQMLDAAKALPETLEEFQKFRDAFVASYGMFTQAVDGCVWKGESRGVHTKIDPLAAAILTQRKVWIDYEGRLKSAVAGCGGAPNEQVARAVASLVGGSDEVGLPGLDRTLWDSLRNVQLTDREYKGENFGAFAEVVQEVHQRFGHIIRLEPGGGAKSDQLLTTDPVRVIGGALKQIHDRLLAARLDIGENAGSPGEWIEEIGRLLDAEAPVEKLSLGPLPPQWRGDELARLHEAHLGLIARAEGRRLLLTIQAALDRPGEWGIAELTADWSTKVPSVYQIAIPRPEERAAAKREPATREAKDKPSARPKRGRRGEGASPGGRTPAPKTPAVVIEKDRLIPACARRDFLNARAEECGTLLFDLRELGPQYYFAGSEDARPLNEVCSERVRKAGEAYMETYVRSWASAYGSKRLAELERLTDAADRWESLGALVQRSDDRRGAAGDLVADELAAALGEIIESLPFWAWYFDESANRWTDAINPDDKDWLEVASWMQRAIEQYWPRELGRFAVDARMPSESEVKAEPGKPPWQVLSDEHVRRWKELTKGIAARGALPSKFDSDAREKDPKAIPWGSIATLRREARIDDEKLTGQLLAFERKAQGLLSKALTETLCGVQARYCRDLEPFDGWPYLNASADTPKALETVDFADFKGFVREMERAWKAFEVLEDALPQDEPLRGPRLEFYRECQAWARFLQLNDQLMPSPLVVEVEGADPVTEPFGKERVQDTAQHYYDAVTLDLALAIAKEGEPGASVEEPLRIPTLTEQKVGKPRKALWRWGVRTGGTGLSVSLVDGRGPEGGGGSRYPSITHALGESSPLALCAYLHRYGVRSGDQWVTSHAFELVTEFKQRGQGNLVSTLDPGKTTVGEKFLFRLERPLPDPVRKLSRP